MSKVIKKTINNIVYWTLPQGFIDVAKKTYYRLLLGSSLKLCRGNSRYRDIHRGKRCFIVCNGPSVNSQNLLSLKDEIVFSVSSGYHHQDYAIYQPRYHCLPQITYTEKLTKEVTNAWFREMHEKIGRAELFLSHQQEPIVRENDLFSGRVVNYVCMYKTPIRDMADISRFMPGVQSVSILCIMIAMYMGFREIYLIGVDHDSFITGEYKYFFEQTVLAGKTGEVTENDQILSLGDELQAVAMLWKQYRELKEVAMNHGITIYNATAGGRLDVFERVSLEELWDRGSL